VFRKKIFDSTDDLQVELDKWLELYNTERTHQGKRCQGRTPMETFIDGMNLATKADLTKQENQAA
jgi:hypothetical protein